jgi:hypothetical protein
MEAIYSNKDRTILAAVGDIVMVPGSQRGIVIDIRGTFVKAIVIAAVKETGETVALKPRYISEFSARDCTYLENQTLNP